MNLSAVILQLRGANTSFKLKVGGAPELALVSEYPLQQEWAFVVPVAESPTPNQDDNDINQRLVERFAVIVALANDGTKTDITGYTAASRLDGVRTELFRALLGWQMPGAESLVSYAGGRFIDADRAWLWWQFEFEHTIRLQALYDPGAGALPELKEFFDQWVAMCQGKTAAEMGLPVTGGIPNASVTSTVEELIKGHAFGAAFDTGYESVG